jgi:hypothetical protein
MVSLLSATAMTGAFVMSAAGVFTATAAPAGADVTSTGSSPIITIHGLDQGGVYAYGSAPQGSATCSAPDGGQFVSGVAACEQSSGFPTNAGTWTVTVTSAETNGNTASVTISYTVTPAPLTITASSSASVYGSPIAAVTATQTGLVNGDGTAAGLSCSSAAVQTSSPGTYTNSCVAHDSNYAVTYVNGTQTIAAAPLTITASSSSSVYGSPIAAVTPTFSGFVDGQSASVLGSALSCSSAAVQSSNVGTYANSCSGANDSNYAVTYVNGTQKITPAPLTITASSATIFYGQAIPAVTPSFSGFVLGQGPSVLGSGLTCVVPATIASDAGTYTTFCVGATDANYAISYVNGSLLIKPAPTSLAATPAVISVLPLFPYLFTLNTQLTSQITGKGLPNQTVTFAIKGGGALCSGTTNGSGVASCQVLFNLPGLLSVTLTDGYTVSFAGTHNYLPSTNSAQLIEVLPGLIL